MSLGKRRGGDAVRGEYQCCLYFIRQIYKQVQLLTICILLPLHIGLLKSKIEPWLSSILTGVVEYRILSLLDGSGPKKAGLTL